jgi:hypothetical protein
MIKLGWRVPDKIFSKNHTDKEKKDKWDK